MLKSIWLSKMVLKLLYFVVWSSSDTFSVARLPIEDHNITPRLRMPYDYPSVLSSVNTVDRCGANTRTNS